MPGPANIAQEIENGENGRFHQTMGFWFLIGWIIHKPAKINRFFQVDC